MNKWVLILTIFFMIASVCFNGCAEKTQARSVNETVSSFLENVNINNYNGAYSFYNGDKYPYPEVLKQIFRDEGFVKDGIADITLKNQVVDEGSAVVTAHCRITEFNLNRQRINPSEKDVHFKLQKENNKWVISGLSFKDPYSLPEKTSGGVVASVSDLNTNAEDDNNYALYLFLIVVSILGILIYSNKKEDSESSKVHDVNLSDAYPLQKDMISRFTKFVPSTQNKSGKKATIDVWVKNSSTTPYENFRVIAVHNNSVKVRNPNLNFGTIAPGQTVKQTWQVKPEVSGTVSLKPAVVFEYMGEKYTGTPDPLRIQVH